MKSWIDDLTETELEVLRVTLANTINSHDFGKATRQHAQLMLSEIEDYLWNSVCRNTPASSDQLQADQQ